MNVSTSGAVQGPRRWTIQVNGLPPSPNRRMNWQKRRRLVQPLADAVAWKALTLGVHPPLERARLQLTLVCAHGPFRDTDNATASCKEIIDALKKIVILDDRPGCLELLPVRQERGPAAMIRLEIEEVLPSHSRTSYVS